MIGPVFLPMFFWRCRCCQTPAFFAPAQLPDGRATVGLYNTDTTLSVAIESPPFVEVRELSMNPAGTRLAVTAFAVGGESVFVYECDLAARPLPTLTLLWRTPANTTAVYDGLGQLHAYRNQDIAPARVVTLDETGNVIRTAFVPDPDADTIGVACLAADAVGNVYGLSLRAHHTNWNLFNVPLSGFPGNYAAVIDPASRCLQIIPGGNLALARNPNSGIDGFVQLYTNGGTLVWEYNHGTGIGAICADAAGYIYLVGAGSLHDGMGLRKIDPEGHAVWSVPVNNRADLGICLGDGGRLYTWATPQGANPQIVRAAWSTADGRLLASSSEPYSGAVPFAGVTDSIESLQGRSGAFS